MNRDEKKSAALGSVEIPDQIKFDPIPEKPVLLREGERLMRVSATSNVATLSTAIARFVQEGDKPVLSCIGAGALNQATKATIRANGVLATKGLTLIIFPSFSLTEAPGHAGLITSIRLNLRLL